MHFDFSHCGCLSRQWEASVEIYTDNIYEHVAWVYGIMSVKHVFLGEGEKQAEKNYLGPYQHCGEALPKIALG